MAFYCGIISAESQAAVAPAFEKQMASELESVLAVVPHDELAIQWASCLEIFIWESALSPFFPNPRQTVCDAPINLGNRVPKPVHLGYTHCYAVSRNKHGLVPKDMGQRKGK